MSSQQPTVVVFDSGVGGLTILAALCQKVTANFVFVSDNAFFPYGNRNESELMARVDRVMDALIPSYQPDLIVVACNTASTVVLPHLRSKYDVPFVGVVPAIKPAARITKSRAIGLLATPGTVRRRYTHDLIKEFAAGCQVYLHGSAALVQIAEEKLQQRPVDQERISAEFAGLLNQSSDIDTVVLGCTHFPLLREELNRAADRPLQWVDSSEAIAQRCYQLLNLREQLVAGTSQMQAVFTACLPTVNSLASTLRARGFAAAPHILNL